MIRGTSVYYGVHCRCSSRHENRAASSKFTDLVPAKVLEKRLLKLKELGTFGIFLTGGGALTLKNLLTSSFHADQAFVP